MYKNLGTIEPRYNDTKVVIDIDESICDDTLAFIYGAIKKYGTRKECLEGLKDYIKTMADKIGEK